MKSLCISIVSHNQNSLIEDLISDLENQAKLENILIKIVIRHNVSSEKKILHNRKLKIIEYWNDKPYGFSANHNLNFIECDHDFFWVLNPDVRITDKNFINHFLELHTDSNSIASCSVYNDKNELQTTLNSSLSIYDLFIKNVLKIYRVKNHSRYFWIVGCFISFPSKLFTNIGGFDEKFFLYVDDVDISLRIFLKNYKLYYFKNLYIIHNARRFSKKKIKYLFFHTSSLIKFFFSKVYFQSFFLRKINISLIIKK